MSQVVIDAIDRKILKYLITNARMPFLEIARKCGISGAAIHQRIKKLDESGVILGSRPRNLCPTGLRRYKSDSDEKTVSGRCLRTDL